MLNRLFILAAVAVLTSTPISRLRAQVNQSVYSMFGIGDLVDENVGTLRAFGGTGIAFRSESSLNYRNPASTVWIPPNALLFEAGAFASYNTSRKVSVRESFNDFKVSYASINTHIADWWALSIGILPFSRVGYVTTSSSGIEGELGEYKTVHWGVGSLNKIYLGQSFRVSENLGVGFNLSRIGGTITETQMSAGNSGLADHTSESVRSYGTSSLDFGTQYTFGIDQRSFTLGLTYGGSVSLPYSEEVTLVSGSTTTSLEPKERSPVSIPERFGIGLATQTTAYRAGIDYQWSNWSSGSDWHQSVESVDRRRFSIGGEYTPGPIDPRSRRISYRVGAYYVESHLKVKKTPIHSLGVTLGLGIPIRSMNLGIALEYGKQGSLGGGLILHDWWMIHVSMSLFEFWLPELIEE